MAKKHDARRGIAINGSRHRAKAKKNGHALDTALEAVREGRTPHLEQNDDYGTRMVEDPYDEKRTDGSRAKSVKIVALRDDPIGRMHKRGQLGRERDRDPHDADVRLDAARRWQGLYDRAEIGGAKAIDFTRDVVDGGTLKLPDTDSRMDAQNELLELDCTLGSEGATLVRFVLGERRQLSDMARSMESARDKLYLGRRLLECLDTIAKEMGLMASRPARGPRRDPDQWDELAPYSDLPRLVEAIRRARER